MTDPLTLIAQICGAHPALLQGGMLAGLVAAGAAGSVMHCAPMCGPFVLGQVADRMARIPAARMTESCRMAQGLLIPYHLGRLTTYAALGALAASLGSVLGGLPWFGTLRVVLLLAAALLFLLHALGRLAPAHKLGAAARLGRVLRRITQRLDRSGPRGTFATGLMLGLLPCGFVYAALTAAAAATGPLGGAGVMLAFGLGTVPILAVIGVAGRAGLRGGPWARRFAPVLLTFNAGVILLVALAT